MDPQQENGTQNPQNDPNNGQPQEHNSDHEHTQQTCGNTANTFSYPECPPQIEQETTEPIFTPINLEICPIINVKILKPKFCVQNQANTKPNCFLD